ncbi:TlpA family protein disulfide reductase [Flagellimonas allohymeniacidonis]|uniref:TlpA family protein disulfide reductase n=1 Tax=Flagellimonas allohymeniacidonis TaxID=2517819 RepID=A0A4Q8Q905_9FLAO|nr:TlpA disulfide reductase family protein [Allomuricauda hymeniacidonis]TAI46722.1 TlpA family protein disulfide reductase [Allomuricauda hymeniacidonis]
MKYLRLSLVLFATLLIGCIGKSKETKDNESDRDVSQNLDPAEEVAVKFPVYDFDGFEPLLHKDDSYTYIVNFWATWCKPCIKELPYFEQVNEEFKDKNVKVLLVSLDMPNMWKSRLEPFVEKKGIQSEVVILDDPKQNDWIPKVAEEWGGGIPATLIYKGKKRNFYEQEFTYEELTQELQQFIN